MKEKNTVLKDTLYFFALYGVLFIPLPLHIFPFQSEITGFIFGDLISYLGDSVFHSPLRREVTSDTFSMYLLMAVLFTISLATALVLWFVKRSDRQKKTMWSASRKVAAYYLALQLLKYGFDKIFKAQFYMPEPNILYSTFGALDKDILFWSAMGTSYLYTIFGGLIEVLSAILLLFRKTRVAGLLIASAILLNVVAINLGFDISVKLFSLFLLFLSLLLLSPQFQRLYHFLILQKHTVLLPEPVPSGRYTNLFLRVSLKTFVIGLLCMEALYPAIKTQNFNDDYAVRHPLHGAYEVREIYLGKQALEVHSLPVKRIFIHRDGYLIFQDHEGSMKDYKLSIDRIHNRLILTDYDRTTVSYQFSHQVGDGILEMQYVYKGKMYLLKATTLNWKNLPALQNQFHWTVDGYK